MSGHAGSPDEEVPVSSPLRETHRGKTTTATRVARTVLRLDEPSTAELIGRDFATATQGRPPVLIDEWQLVPSVWDSVRRAVEADRTAGRFILTGSSRNAVSVDLHAGAGRFTVLRLEPTTLSEHRGSEPAIPLEALADDGIEAVAGRRSPFSMDEQISAMFLSGLPEYRSLGLADQQRSLRTYVDLSLARDVAGVTGISRDTVKLRAYVHAYATVVGTNADHGAVFRSAGVAKAPGEAYHDVLTRIAVIDDLHGWANNRLRRMAKSTEAPPG